MTTPAHSDLAQSLTRLYFGDNAATVISTLFKYDQLPLGTLKSELSDLELAEIKDALLTLVRYQLVDYVKSVRNLRNQYEYSVATQRVFSIFRIPRFIFLVIEKLGRIAGVIVSKVAENAMLNCDDLIRIVSNEVKLMPEPPKDDEINNVIETSLEHLLVKRYIVKLGDFYCLNIERLVREYRDSLIVDAVYTFYQDSKIRHLSETILRLSQANTDDISLNTAPVTFSELVTDLVPSKFSDRGLLERYLSRLTSESNNRFFASCGVNTSKGPMFALDIGQVIDYIVKEHLSTMISSRFGPRCCRVFRVLLLRGPLMLKQVEEFIMLPARDVREYSYMLMKEGLIRNQQVPKTPDNAPGKSVFIMSVELDQLVYNAADQCCRTINNLLLRHESEMVRNKSILDRSEAVNRLAVEGQVGEEGEKLALQDLWGQYFNSHEISQLNLIYRTLDRIFLAKFQVDEMLFLLHCWISLRPDLRDDVA